MTSIKVGQYVDLNDGFGFQKVTKTSPDGFWIRLDGGGEYRADSVVEVRDADEMETKVFDK